MPIRRHLHDKCGTISDHPILVVPKGRQAA